MRRDSRRFGSGVRAVAAGNARAVRGGRGGRGGIHGEVCGLEVPMVAAAGFAWPRRGLRAGGQVEVARWGQSTVGP